MQFFFQNRLTQNYMKKYDNLEEYFSQDLGWGNSQESKKVFSFLSECAEFSRRGVVLDAGSGYQRYRPFFKESIYVGQEHPIAGAQNKQIENYDILCDVENIPLKQCSVKTVLSTSSLEHFQSPNEFIKESFRVLMPGGRIYINVPFAIQEHEIPFDFQRYTRYGLESLLERQGFTVQRIEPTSSSLTCALHLLHYSLSEELHLRQNMLLKGLLRLSLYGTYLISKLWVELLDRGASNLTKLPFGWNVIAEKPGSIVPGNNVDSKENFLKENLIVSS